MYRHTEKQFQEVYRQQQLMYDHRSHRANDRVACISQPQHMRPIKRGKAESDTELGTKLSVCIVDGYTFVDRTSWDNFNECLDWQDQRLSLVLHPILTGYIGDGSMKKLLDSPLN